MAIKAMIFDLDGTLVQTEKLKAISYAKAVQELCPAAVSEAEVIETFKDVVGLSRHEVAETLIQRFGLAPSLQARMPTLGAKTDWEAFVHIRLRQYDGLLADLVVLLKHQWPHNMALLRAARETNCKVGLATMSYRAQVERVLHILTLEQAFDFVASREDVKRGKPDPEIYRLVSSALGVPPAECLVIEDSPTGVKAALAASMWVVAVTTPFTREAFRKEPLLAVRWIVDDPATLPAVVEQLFHAHSASV
jgi:HAD superfamily hydrolase (TIGR01509 family)